MCHENQRGKSIIDQALAGTIASNNLFQVILQLVIKLIGKNPYIRTPQAPPATEDDVEERHLLDVEVVGGTAMTE